VLLVGAAGGWFVYLTRSPRRMLLRLSLAADSLLLSDQPVEYLLSPAIPQTSADYDFVVQVWTLDGVRVYLSRAPHCPAGRYDARFSTASRAKAAGGYRRTGAHKKVIQVAQPMRVRERQAWGLHCGH